MLQEVTYNGTHRDVLGKSRNPCLQTADTTYDQFDFHARIARLIQCTDNRRITQGIHLGNDLSTLTHTCILCLPVDQCKESILHPDRSYKQFIPCWRLGITRQHIKDCGCILPYRIRCSQHTHICI